MGAISIEDETRIDAPASAVWRAIADPAAHAAWHPYLTDISGEHRLGELRRCSVSLNGKPASTVERCVEEQPERRITWSIEKDTSGFSRMVTDWQAGFEIDERGDATTVTARSIFKPRNPLVRAMGPMIRRKFHQTQRSILAALRESVEAQARTV